MKLLEALRILEKEQRAKQGELDTGRLYYGLDQNPKATRHYLTEVIRWLKLEEQGADFSVKNGKLVWDKPK